MNAMRSLAIVAAGLSFGFSFGFSFGPCTAFAGSGEVSAEVSADVSADVSAEPLQESNTVLSAELITDFALIKDASDAEVTGAVNLFKAGKGEKGPVLLAISADDVISISVEGKSVTCLQNKECRLPFIKGAIYRSEFRRYNGEIIKAETLLPNETKVLSPADNSKFSKNDGIRISWVVSRPDGPRGITVSVFLGDQIKTCSTTGGVDWDTEGTATVPEKYVGTCRAPLRARFGVFYVNVNPMRGVGGGTLKGYSTARLFFNYVDPEVQFEIDQKPLTLADVHEFNQAQKTGQRVTQTIRR